MSVSSVVPGFKPYYKIDCQHREFQIGSVINTIGETVAELADGLMSSFPIDRRLLAQLLTQHLDKNHVPIELKAFEKCLVRPIKDHQDKDCIHIKIDSHVQVKPDNHFYYVVAKATQQQMEAGQLPKQGETSVDAPPGVILEGRSVDQFGNIRMGRFNRSNSNRWELQLGKMFLSEGGSWEGVFTYLPNTHEIFLKSGVVTAPNGDIEVGHWRYNPDTQSTELCHEYDLEQEEIDSKLKNTKQHILKELIQIYKFASPNLNKMTKVKNPDEKIRHCISLMNSAFCKMIDVEPRCLNDSTLQDFERNAAQIERAKFFNERLDMLNDTLTDIQELAQSKKILCD